MPCRAAIVAALLGATGCTALRATLAAYETGPLGISRPQQQLREALTRADFPVALGWHEDDELLRELGVGVSSYYAAQYVRCAAVLDSAAFLADDRSTSSLSGNALALITNDLALPYRPRRTERLFIPYYSMLAYVRLEQWEDAVVEARRLSALLAQFAVDREDSERATHGTLHYLAGVVFERAGERGEALVAYRLARAILRQPVERARDDRSTGAGDVLVVLERGFVAHRATESFTVVLGEAERDHDRGRDGDDDDGGSRSYRLSVAFPAVRRAVRAAGEPVLLVDGTPVTTVRVASLLDDAALADEGRERAALLARAVARAAAKYVVIKAVKDKTGAVAGSIANIGASLLERADIRSWHLLPQEITLLRVRAAPGQRQLQLAIGREASRVELGPVTVRAGMVTIAAVRLWR